MKRHEREQAPLRWYTLNDAAERLALSVDALRRQFERRDRTGAAAVMREANIDSVRARKFGHLWRVSFGERWVE